MSEVFRLENPTSIETQVADKKRRNIAKESSERTICSALTRISFYLYDRKDVAKRDAARASTVTEKRMAKRVVHEVEAFEEWLDYHFKDFRIADEKARQKFESLLKLAEKEAIERKI